MLHLVSGINSLCLFVNLIPVPVPPFPTYCYLNGQLPVRCQLTSATMTSFHRYSQPTDQGTLYVTALFKIVNDALVAADQGMVTIVVFLD